MIAFIILVVIALLFLKIMIMGATGIIQAIIYIVQNPIYTVKMILVFIFLIFLVAQLTK